MYSPMRMITNLSKIAGEYVCDLEEPFLFSREANELAETPILLIDNVCRALGMNHVQRTRVLGRKGVAFIEFLENPPTEFAGLLGDVPVVGTVENGCVRFHPGVDL